MKQRWYNYKGTIVKNRWERRTKSHKATYLRLETKLMQNITKSYDIIFLVIFVNDKKLISNKHVTVNVYWHPSSWSKYFGPTIRIWTTFIIFDYHICLNNLLFKASWTKFFLLTTSTPTITIKKIIVQAVCQKILFQQTYGFFVSTEFFVWDEKVFVVSRFTKRETTKLKLKSGFSHTL